MKPDIAVKPDRAAKPRRTLKPRRGAKVDRIVQPDRTLQPDRAADAGRQQVSQAQREEIAQAPRERAAQAERERAARVQRERAAQAERERAEAELQRAAQAEAERSAQAERERAAQAEPEPAAQAKQDSLAKATIDPFLALKTERTAKAETGAETETAAESNVAASPAKTDSPKADPGAEEPDDAAQPDPGKWLPEDYFRPLSAVRDPVDKKAEWAKKAQEGKGKDAQWDERIPWDEQEPWDEQPQPEEQAQSDVLNASRGHSRRTSTLAATVVAVVIAGSVGLALALRSSPSGPHGNHGPTVAEVRSQAAAWVTQQVSHNTVVSCDHAMCAALAQHHFPANNLHVLDSTSSNPAGSTVIISTPTVRSQFGSSLGSSLAPVILARFGTGNAQIDVRVVAPHGAAAYRQELAQDIKNRKQTGAELLSSPRITISAVAHRQLAAGLVDPRLLVEIVTLAAQRPLKILAFSDSGPHASPGVPLRMADLAETNGVAQPPWTRSMLALLNVQQDPFLPALDGTTSRAGKTVLFIKFAAPTPLGLLD